MANINVHHEVGKTIITVKPDIKSFLIRMPYIAYFVAICAVVIVAFLKVITEITHPKSSPILVAALACVVLFGFKCYWLGRWLSVACGVTGTLIVQGDTLSIQKGRFWTTSDSETYAASEFTNLRWEGSRGFLQTGIVTADIGSTPLILMAGLDDSDGNKIIDLLTEAYAFKTPDADASPAVVKW